MLESNSSKIGIMKKGIESAGEFFSRGAQEENSCKSRKMKSSFHLSEFYAPHSKIKSEDKLLNGCSSISTSKLKSRCHSRNPSPKSNTRSINPYKKSGKGFVSAFTCTPIK
jgi:hypothetical protein